MLGRSAAAGSALRFDGDQASAVFRVTAPHIPLQMSQTATCLGTLVVGTPTTCAIVVRVVNLGLHRLDLSHTIVIHVSSGVRVVSATASTGRISAGGRSVVWNSFQLGPEQSASARITVAVTPNASQVSRSLALTDGITADGLDVTTGQRFKLSYGPLATKVRVAGALAAHANAQPAAQSAPAPAGGGQPPGTSSLPATGGAALGPIPDRHRRAPINRLAARAD